MRALVAADPLKLSSERAPHRQFHGVVAIVPPVAQAVQAVLRNGRVARQRIRSEREPSVSQFRYVRNLAVKFERQLAFEAQAGDAESGDAQSTLVHQEGR